MLTVTTLMVTGIFFVQGVSDFLVKELQAKIDVTAYFKEEVQEADILSVKDELLKDTENVKGIEYISKEQALETFLATHDEDEVFLNALNEVGGNPFLSSLNISTFGKPMEYENISRVLAQENFSSFIEKVDYSHDCDFTEAKRNHYRQVCE